MNLICICFIILFFCILIYLREKQHTSEIKDLMNRIMARDYKEYAAFEEFKTVKVEPGPIKNLFDAQDAFPVD
jgi:hypothetical protein